MKNPRRIYDQQLYAHFVTFSVSRRRRLLEADPPRRILLGILNEALDRFSARCQGFVVMPEHVHVLIWFPVTGCLSRFMHAWKRRSSRMIQDWYRWEIPGYLQETSDGVFWQRKYYAFEIYEHAKLEEKLEYMHLNPVRVGLVEKAVDWKWSSARWYEQGRTVGVPLRWVE